MKLSKTEATLLSEAAAHRYGRTCTISGFYSGARSGIYGTHRANAANALLHKGFLRLISREQHRHIINNGWTTDHCTEMALEITVLGRAAIAR